MLQAQQHMAAAQMLQAAASQAFDVVRRKYLTQLHVKTGRNIIAYYSGWLSKPENILNLGIVDEDKNGFMMAVHGMDRTKNLDLLLHTPGGSLAATESIVDYLRQMFPTDIRVIVPQLSMSAGTMIACCANKVLMARHSSLGPIDPQIRGVPAYGVIQEFRRAYREIKKDPQKAEVWRPILAKYNPTFLSECENGIRWASSFVEGQLKEHMFKDVPRAGDRARKVVKRLTDYTGNKAHNRHINFEECKKMGLDVDLIETVVDAEFQDLVLTVHHCLMHSLMNTNAFKIIENQSGAAFIKQNVASAVPQQRT
ncbi:MAG TPA: ATP-dependent Clp protease proteolytic subunit [Stellaceae bacterium]|nr:ATP-dependent Clp protease proteolytic subunit [Stellaceae bacterium]